MDRVLQGSYNPNLVILSIAIAIFAAYTSLNLISRLSRVDEHEPLAYMRTASAGLVMGIGIWTMHFVGMLAYSLPIAVRYDGVLTLWSLLVAVAACTVGLVLASFRRDPIWWVVGGGVIGFGISAMHYIGMHAMRLSAMMQHDLLWVLSSVMIGVGASIGALVLAFALGRGDIQDSWRTKTLSSILMGLAIAGMHYSGMTGLQLHPAINAGHLVSGLELNPSLIGAILAIAITLILAFTLWSIRLVAESSLIKTNEEKIRAITENILDVIITINHQGIIEFANAATCSVLGYRAEELTGTRIVLLMAEPWREDYINLFGSDLALVQGNNDKREIEVIHKDGNIVSVEFELSSTKISGKKIHVSVIRDISERLAVQKKLYELAHYDHLTSLPNRYSFLEYIEKALQHAQRNNKQVAILFLDLDRFKVINDTLGHHVGDELLKIIALRLKDSVSAGDTIARLSGDEFTILLEDVEALDEVAPIAHKIISDISEPFILQGQELYTSASIGISLYPEDSLDSQTLMRYADVAMYRAKYDGGNSYRFYTSDMNARANERLQLENELRHAMERDEFVLYYQPKMDLKTGCVSGVEALLRWQHPVHGIVPPVDFISLLEETGLIAQVGEWVVRTACEQSKIWQASISPTIHMAVNLSAKQFYDSDLHLKVAAILQETGMAAEYLELEITENILMQNDPATIENIQHLHKLGVRLALDDFGTGYSSLSYLKKFPVHTLKIDRSFVRDISTDQDDAAIVRLIIDMANSLKLHVVAEGVETREQLAFLQANHCGEIQGYLLSHPRAAAEIYPYLQECHELMDFRLAEV